MKLRFWISELDGRYAVYAYKNAQWGKHSEQMYVAGRKNRMEAEKILEECRQVTTWSEVKGLKRKYSLRRKRR